SISLLSWAFLTADHARWRQLSNTVVLSLLPFVAIAYAISGIFWIEIASEIDFNLTSFGLSWTFALFALPILGVLGTYFLFRDVTDSPLKLVYFILIAIGGGLTLFQMTQIGVIGN